MNEKWNFIGSTKEYMISTLGRVKSFKKNTDGKIMKIHYNNKGYARIELCISNEKQRKHSIHRLVCEGFLDNPEFKPCVNHIDNNPSNNNLKNLEWCTYSENLLHAEKQGRLANSHKKCGKATKKIMIDKKISEIKSINVIGNFKIFEINNIKKTGKKNIYYVDVECSCGKTTVENYEYIKRDIIKTCLECRWTNVLNKNFNTFYKK